MIPDPTPVAVPESKGPRFVATSDVSVTTESFALATTAVMSSCCTVVWAPPDAATLAAAPAAGAGETGGALSSTMAKVDPDASAALSRAAPTTGPSVRRFERDVSRMAGGGAADPNL